MISTLIKSFFSFVPNKQFEHLTIISSNTLTMMNTVITEFSQIEVSFTDQFGKPFEIEHNANLMLIIA